MNNPIKNKIVPVITLLLAAILTVVAITLSGCTPIPGEGFAIYITTGDIPPADITNLEDIHITEKPIVAMDEVVSYNRQTYELKVTEAAFKRIYELQVPVRGTSFAVCVDRKPVYQGAFWTPVSSISYDGVTIWKPYDLKSPYILSLELGYPSTSFYQGEDPRNNLEVLKTLEKAGKLVTKLSIDDIDQLPASMKGYELYSWRQADGWNYTLITGTNRDKTGEEIVTGDDFISEAGWIRIHVVGEEALDKVISKLNTGASVFWLSFPRSGAAPLISVNFGLPPEDVIRSVKEYAGNHGIDLAVLSRP
jgi:hypothetical protein